MDFTEKSTASTNSMAVNDLGASNSSSSAATPTFLGIPRELRDSIYDQVALNEYEMNLRIVLKKSEKLQTIIFATGGLGHTSAQLKVEYSAAIERRVKALMGNGDLAGKQLVRSNMGVATLIPRLDVWQKQHTDHVLTQNVRAFKFSIPYDVVKVCPSESKKPPGMLVAQELIVAFEFDDTEELGARLSFEGPVVYEGDSELSYKFSRDCVPVVEQIMSIAKTVDWKGSMRWRMFWQAYGVRYMRVNRFVEDLVVWDD